MTGDVRKLTNEPKQKTHTFFTLGGNFAEATLSSVDREILVFQAATFFVANS